MVWQLNEFILGDTDIKQRTIPLQLYNILWISILYFALQTLLFGNRGKCEKNLKIKIWIQYTVILCDTFCIHSVWCRGQKKTIRKTILEWVLVLLVLNFELSWGLKNLNLFYISCIHSINSSQKYILLQKHERRKKNIKAKHFDTQ